MSAPAARRPVAVVTGASRGLGFLLAAELGRRGHDLVIGARSADGLAAARTDLERTGARVLPVPGDLAVRAQAEQLVAVAVEQYGRIDMVVNNAGVIEVGPAVAMTVENLENAMGIMFWGTAYTSLAALPHMREQGSGTLVNITSVGGKLPAPHLLAYTAAKFAAVGFSEGLRAELGKEGISVTTVVPGLMRTGSPLNALFKGDPAAEYKWFTLGDSVPLLSIDARRAARKICDAAARGKPELMLTPLAKIGARVHGLAPGLSTRMAAGVDRMLPRNTDPGRPTPGHAVDGTASGRLFRGLTQLTRTAAARTHQHDDAVAPPR